MRCLQPCHVVRHQHSLSQIPFILPCPANSWLAQTQVKSHCPVESSSAPSDQAAVPLGTAQESFNTPVHPIYSYFDESFFISKVNFVACFFCVSEMTIILFIYYVNFNDWFSNAKRIFIFLGIFIYPPSRDKPYLVTMHYSFYILLDSIC